MMGSAVLGGEEDDDMTEFERARRIPFMLPTTFLGRRQYGFENEGDNDDSADGMKRKRIPYYFRNLIYGVIWSLIRMREMKLMMNMKILSEKEEVCSYSQICPTNGKSEVIHQLKILKN